MLRVRNNRVRLLILAALAAVLIAVILISAAAYPDSAVRPTSGQRNLEPSWHMPLGTDWLGRDMFARTMKGMALSLCWAWRWRWSPLCCRRYLPWPRPWGRNGWTGRSAGWWT